MTQIILVGVIFLVALFYLGRYIYRQATAGKDDVHCDRCLPKDQQKK
jgi:hypothetical protein